MSVKRLRAVVAGVTCAGALAALAHVGGCGTSEEPSVWGPEAGSDVLRADAPIDARTVLDAADIDPGIPPGLPDGWVLDRSYSNHCSFYIPGSADKLPAPLRWEPCPASVTPSGAACRLMAIDSPPVVKDTPAGADTGWVRSDGSVVLGAYRSAMEGGYHFFADADGPVHSAILVTDPARCTLGNASVVDGRYTLDLYEYATSGGGGLLAGDLMTLGPRLGIHLSQTGAHDAYAGPFAILDLNADYRLDAYSWESGTALPSIWSASQDNGLQQGAPVFASGAMFWQSSNLWYQKVTVHTPSAGVRDFLTPGTATDRGRGELGTDGKDLVWIDAQGHTGTSFIYDTQTIMTAPFTTEPAAVVARRLRSENGPGFGVSPFVVGCGFAARSNGLDIRVVRLADGQSWNLANGTAPWAWNYPLAITCTELFAMVIVDRATRLARVRLDSLGPGIPPD